jgi:hypothetical protein
LDVYIVVACYFLCMSLLMCLCLQYVRPTYYCLLL